MSSDADSATSKVVFVPTAVNVDQAFSDAVQVNDTALVIPTAMLGSIKVGSIVAGDRSSKGDANPYGFLRKVTSVQTDGDTTTLVTQQAELADWIYAGKIDFSSRRSLFSGAQVKDTGAVTQALDGDAPASDAPASDPPATTTAPATVQADFNHTIPLAPAEVAAKGTVTAKAALDGFFQIKRKEVNFVPDPPQGAAFKALLAFDPAVAGDFIWKLAKGAGKDSTWTGPSVMIPLPAPIPITVRFAPQLKCNVNANGDGSVTVAANVGVHAVVGFQGSAGLSQIDTTNLTEAPTGTGNVALKSVQGKATATAGCELVATPELLLFDAAGITGRVGPYSNLNATACASSVGADDSAGGFTLTEEHGIAEQFTARIQVPILGIGKEFALWNGRQNFGGPTYLQGDANTCAAPSIDSCAGKTDGFHCSEAVAYGGIVCENGQILRGLQCDDISLKCASGDETTIQCQ